jgi:ribonucleotide reductase alpha subunit
MANDRGENSASRNQCYSVTVWRKSQPFIVRKLPSLTRQLPGRHVVQIDRSRDALLTDFGKDTLSDRYLLAGESYQDLFARVASAYGDDAAHSQRLYDYMSKLWFMPATPVLSNGGTNRGLPISCFLNECTDSLEGIVNLWNENVWLAAKECRPLNADSARPATDSSRRNPASPGAT